MNQQISPEMATRLENRIVQQLERYGNHSDIIREICSVADLNWDDAEEFFNKTRELHAPELDRKTNKLAIPLSVMFIVSGIFILTATYFMLWVPLTRLVYQFQTGTVRFGTALSLLLLASPQTYVALYAVGAFCMTAIGMIVGGVVGLYRAWDFLNN